MNQPAKNAMNRYLKDLKKALCAAPKAAKADALRDAAEFLSNEISSPDAEHLVTSEQPAYDHFVERYGSPRQVAAEYLQTSETTSHTASSPNCWMSLKSLNTALNMALLIGLVTVGVFLMDRSRPWPMLSSSPPKISPFTQVDFTGDKILVEFDGTTYEWLGIDGIPVEKVTATSKRLYRDLWRKRIVEDLVEVLWGMGHKPGDTVKLQLRDLQQNSETTIAAAPMTRANRQSMYGNYLEGVSKPVRWPSEAVAAGKIVLFRRPRRAIVRFSTVLKRPLVYVLSPQDKHSKNTLTQVVRQLLRGF